MIGIEHSSDHKFVTIRASGTLTAEDYERAIPELENAINLADGNLNALIGLENLKGWSLEALWKDLKFDVKHYNDFRRIAVVGESDTEETLTKLSGFVTGADLRYFDRKDWSEAEAWVRDADPTA